MLKIINLHKDYHTKAEVTHALKSIHLEFLNKGFIILLGKSGSGKSTLLNLIGGLDKADEGEIIINGQSTKDYQKNDWDAFRNTFVGFVFQEFYMMEEFSVGKNIALALELQGIEKTKVDQSVDNILQQVDLEGYKDRMPNQISGGQKQRIAIARALIKDPQIILADEPTGNLDSDTGRLILDTLKKLSQTRLVIMVTHDQDFAKEYGDRIIELKDGFVISDTLNESIHKSDVLTKNGAFKMLTLPTGKPLTEEMIETINTYAQEDDLYFSISHNEDYLAHYTTPFTIESHNEDQKLKSASLSLLNAYKMAFNSLKVKKIRLAITLFLFIMALIFVGIGSTLSFYDSHHASVMTFSQAKLSDFEVIYREHTCYESTYNGQTCYWQQTNATDNAIIELQEAYPLDYFLKSIERNVNGFTNETPIDSAFYSASFSKISILKAGESLPLDYEGTYPDEDNEILITDYMAVSLEKYGILSDSDPLIGQTLNFTNQDDVLTITGIIQTNYLKFIHLETAEEDQLWNSGFEEYQSNYYETMYTSQSTFENLFTIFRSYLSGMVLDFASPHHDLSGPLIGRMPEKSSEVVIPLSRGHLISLDSDLSGNNTAIESGLGRILSIKTYNQTTLNYTVVGIVDDSQADYDVLLTQKEFNDLSVSQNNSSSSGIQNIVIEAILTNPKDLSSFLYYLSEHHYLHETPFSSAVYGLDSFANNGRIIFYWIGGFFAFFATLLIMTYISSSITNKKQEIGTLRAIGARGKDVAKIFVVEGILIALFASIIANIGTTIIIFVINKVITNQFNLNVILMYINIYSILFVLGLSLLVVAIASILPVWRISRMKPIYAIKNLKSRG